MNFFKHATVPRRVFWTKWRLIPLLLALLIGTFFLVAAIVLIVPIWIEGRHIKHLNIILARPENYKPAAIALARLCETDPKLLDPGMNEQPPDWTPPELGKLGPLEIDVENDTAFLSTTGGLDEFNGYRLDLDKEACDSKNNAWVLTFDGLSPMNQTPAYHFSIPKNDGYTEVELVKAGLAELSRRKAAEAAGTDLALGGGENPDVIRNRFLWQHHPIAVRLGLLPSTEPSTQP